MELKFKITEKKLDAVIKVKEDKDWNGVPEFKTYLIIPALLGDEEVYITKDRVVEKKGTPAIELWVVDKERRRKIEKAIGKKIPKKITSLYLKLDKETYDKIHQFFKDVKQAELEAKEKYYSSYPDRYIVQKQTIQELDMYFDHLVLKLNKPFSYLSEENRKKAGKIEWAVKETNKAIKEILAGASTVSTYYYIPAPEGAKEGDEFTIDKIYEYYKDIIAEAEKIKAEKEKKKQEKEKEYQEKVEKALEEAKRTGKEVIIRLVYQFDADDMTGLDRIERAMLEEELKEAGLYDDIGELGIVSIYEVATPDGKITTKLIPSY